MKNFAKIILLFAANYLLLQIAFASNGTLPLTGQEVYQSGGIPTPAANQDAFATIENFFFGTLAYLKPIVAIVGILYLTIAGYRMVVNGAEEDEVSKAKKTITYTIVAFIVISMSQDLAKIFDMSNGTFLKSPQEILSRVRLFDRQVELVITFIKYILGAIATVMLIRTGARMVTTGANEDEISKEKQSIIYIAGALMMIFIGEVFVNRVLYRVDKTVYTGISGVHPQIGVKEGIEEITGLTNFALTIAGPLVLLILIIAAFNYVTANGEEEQMEKAKRMITAAVIGMVIIYGAFAVISTVIAGKLEDINSIVT